MGRQCEGNRGGYPEALGRSGPLLEFIEWRTDEHRNVVVVNDTADLYRYPDVSDDRSCTEPNPRTKRSGAGHLR
jgi:hypothetical protein